jgi:hypothetical protein
MPNEQNLIAARRAWRASKPAINVTKSKNNVVVVRDEDIDIRATRAAQYVFTIFSLLCFSRC